MTFDQEIHPRLTFARNPLKVVVAQVRFPAAYALADAAGLAAFQAAIRERYPISLPRAEQITFTLGPGGGQQEVSAGPARFSDESRTRIVNITTDWASYETTDYESWDEFRARLAELLDVIYAQVQPVQVTRLGVRYVDEIVIDGVISPLDWQGIISPSLLGAAESPLLDERAAHSLQQISLNMGEDTINLRHSYTRGNPDQGPASSYVIDTDLFSEQEQPWNAEALLERADRYHAWAWSLFIRSLTPDGIERLGGEELR